MSHIPPDIYKKVKELEVAIVDAFEAEDDALHETNCKALRAYYDEQTAAGRAHPFLTEAMADFTDDQPTAVRLYELAIEQSKAFPDEPVHTKMISLAEHLIELDRIEEAKDYLQRGRAEAQRCGDKYWAKEADRSLKLLKG